MWILCALTGPRPSQQANTATHFGQVRCFPAPPRSPPPTLLDIE